MAANLTAADTISGGSGTDTLSVSGTVLDAALAKVTSVEVLTDSALATVTLGTNALAAGITTVNLKGGAVDTLTVAAGYTGTLTVNNTAADNDVIDASATAGALNVVTTSVLTADTVTGGTSTSDVLTFDITAGSITQTSNATITGIETINTTGSTTNNLSVTLANANIAAGKTLTINGSALTTGTLTVVGTSELDGSLVVIGGAAGDSITGTASIYGDNLSGGAGNDTFTMAANLNVFDTISGGSGTDTLSVSGTVIDSSFTKVTSVEVLTDSALASVTIDAGALAAGIATVNLKGGAVDTLTVGAGYTGTLTVNNTAADNDVVSASGSAAALHVVTTSVLTADTVTGGTSTNDVLTFDITAGSITQTPNATITGIETINTTGSTTNSVSVTLANANVAAGKTITVNGSALTTGTLTVDGALLVSTKTLVVTGGAGSDTVTSGAGADTINTGAGVDHVTATAGSTATVNLGAGDDIITFATSGMVTVTGGSGADTFTVSAKTLGGSVYDTIADAETTDIIQFTDQGTDAWASVTAAASKVVLGAAASFSDYVNASVVLGGDSSANAHEAWFTYGGNTYVVHSLHDATTTATFTAADEIIQITGVKDLTGSVVSAAGAMTLTVA
jgi:hypothetical protein